MDELAALDPIALLRGGRAAAWPGRDAGHSGGTVWRVRLPGRVGAVASARGGMGCAVATSDIELVGGCDDVADLLAAVACKHWLAAMMHGAGADRRRRAAD